MLQDTLPCCRSGAYSPPVSDEEFFCANVSDEARFREAIRRFDALNAEDPNLEISDGREDPRELLNSRRLCAWVLKLHPLASEELRLDACSQHLCRWQIPRDSYPLTRAGYHQWKNDLKKFHAGKSAAVLRAAGYPETTVARVADLNLKRNFPADPEARVMEDALCLVFIEFQLADLAARTDEEKVVNALKKSWAKMTPLARDEALKLSLGARETELIQRALSD